MDNYNPRQNTRMRWRVAKELEKFLFISEKFNFQNEEAIENASQDKLYFKIVNEIIKDSKNVKSTPLIIFDEVNGNIYVGYVNDDSSAFATYTGSNNNSILEFEYHGETDTLNIHLHDEIYVTADYVKTLFGNQSIIGTGNIDLYRHDLIIYHNRTSYDDYAYKVYVTYYSSNPLKVDSVQDLTTLTKAVIGTELIGPVVINNTSGDDDYDTVSQSYIGVRYNGNIWGICSLNDGTITTLPINKVSDTVTTI